MRHGERCDHRDQRTKAAERDHQAEQKQQVINPIENMFEAEHHEAQRRLVPSRIEPDEAAVVMEVEGTHRAARQHQPQGGIRPQPQSIQLRVDREARLVRSDGVLEENIEHPFFPLQFRVVR